MEAGQNRRSYVQNLNGGPPTPLTPGGHLGGFTRLKGTLGAAIGDDLSGISIIPDGRRAVPMVRGSQNGDRPVAWTNDDKALWIFRRYEVPLQIVRLDIATGNRQNWRTLVPSDGTGVY